MEPGTSMDYNSGDDAPLVIDESGFSQENPLSDSDSTEPQVELLLQNQIQNVFSQKFYFRQKKLENQKIQLSLITPQPNHRDHQMRL